MCAPSSIEKRHVFRDILSSNWERMTNKRDHEHGWTMSKETLSKTRVNSIHDYPVSIYKAKWDPVRRHSHKDMTYIVQILSEMGTFKTYLYSSTRIHLRRRC